jgi:hypothetical protein
MQLSFVLQANHGKQVQELMLAQAAVAEEHTRVGAQQEELKAKGAELVAQVSADF